MATILERAALADAGIGEAVAGTATRLREGTVGIRNGRAGGGAGIIWTDDGVIVTNAHVATKQRAHVTLPDGRTAVGDVVASDPWRDLAAIRIPIATPQPMPRADARSLRPGDLVLAMGHPLGWEHATSLGTLHAVERIGGHGPARWLRAAVRLMPGNSGGPLADADGRVLGINALVASGLAFAVPIEAVDALLARDRPALGVALRPAAVIEHRRRMFAMVVVDVAAGSAAARAGIRRGDAIRSIGGLALAAPSDVAQLMHAAQSAERIVVGVVRDGRTLELDAEVRRGPPGARAA